MGAISTAMTDDEAVRQALPKLGWFNTTKADRYSKQNEKTER
jgi:hypothetical protein